jgi:hypothetical protein
MLRLAAAAQVVRRGDCQQAAAADSPRDIERVEALRDAIRQVESLVGQLDPAVGEVDLGGHLRVGDG